MNKENLLNEALNRYFKSVKESHPNLIEREILEIAANLAIKEVEKKLGEGTKLINTNDGPISRVDHKWQQEKGSNISNDGFFKEGFDTVTLPKSIDTDTPEGNKTAGKIVDQLKDAKKRVQFLNRPFKEFVVPYKDEFEEYKGERTGNKLMPKPCNMCGYKKYCWKNATLHDRVTSKAKQPPQVWYTRLKKKVL